LRDRFVLGSGSRSINTTGGEENVTLNVNQMPSHSHSGTTGDAGNHQHSGSTSTDGNHAHAYQRAGMWGGGNSGAYSWRDWGNNANWENGGYAGNHSHTLSTNTTGNHSHSFSTNAQGGGGSHNNMPPFYVLAYIMKL
jgi:microcystin-dependent protein